MLNGKKVTKELLNALNKAQNLQAAESILAEENVEETLPKLIAQFCGGLAVNDITPPYGYENLAYFLISNGVEIPVRCRECKFYVDAPKYAISSSSNPNAKICRHPELDFDTECADHWIWMEPEDFCSRGDKKQT